jgi:hypothetical protein
MVHWSGTSQLSLKEESTNVKTKTKATNEEYEAYSYAKFLTDFEVCRADNYVADRTKGDIYQQVPSDQTARPFSLRPEDFQRNHPQPHHRKECSSAQELLKAIKYGQRQWDEEDLQNSTDWVQKEQVPSVFVPHECTIPLLSPQRMCSILRRFSHVVFLGDSLTRHVWQGFVSGIQPDFVRGWVKHSPDATMSHKCYCDGQYSEHPSCRKIPWEMLHTMDLQPYCRNDTSTSIANVYMHSYAHAEGPPDFNNFDGIHNCSTPITSSTDERPMLLILQGGLHFGTNATRTFQHFGPIFDHPVVQTCAQQQKLHMIWSSFDTHSPSTYQMYPFQSATNGNKFNQEMQDLFSQHNNMVHNLTIVDWMNLTQGAQTSDGVHHLTNVNYFKAQYLLLLGDFMNKEGKMA